MPPKTKEKVPPAPKANPKVPKLKPVPKKTPKSKPDPKKVPKPAPKGKKKKALDDSPSPPPPSSPEVSEEGDSEQESDESEEPVEVPKVQKKRKRKNDGDAPVKQQDQRRNQVVTSRAEIKISMTYSGGTDLHPFRSEFWRVAKVNQWPEDYQTVALSAQLSGLAKSYVDSLLEEAVDTVTPTEIFLYLESKFMSSEAMALAQSRLNDMRQQPDEDIRTFSTRFLKAMKACGQHDNTVQAISFFRATRAMGKLAYDSAKFVSVHKVTEAVRDWELTQEWMSKVDHKPEPVPKRRGQLDGTATSGRGDERFDDGADEDDVPGTKRKFNKAVSYSVNEVSTGPIQRYKPDPEAHRQTQLNDSRQWSQSALRPGSTHQPDATVCQLCQIAGHTAPDCPKILNSSPTMTCARCFQPGHVASYCPSRSFCTHCSKPGHTIDTCWSIGAQGGNRGRGRGLARGTGRGYGQRGGFPQHPGRGYGTPNRQFQPRQSQPTYGDRDERCYQCGESGHYSRDCTQPLRRNPVKQELQSNHPVKQEQLAQMQVDLQRLTATVRRDMDDATAGGTGRSSAAPGSDGAEN